MSTAQRARPVSSLRSRRRFFGQAGLASVGLLGAASLPFKLSALSAQTVTDFDILNFALNLEYLEAEYYLRAVYGTGLSGADITGTDTGGGNPGPVIVKGGSTVVPWQNENVRQYAVEIANDELAHVRFIRAAIQQFGGTPVARPTIDLRDSFTAAAVAAGLISGGGGGAVSCPPGQPPPPKPAPNWVPTADCTGWVPPDHPLATGGGGGSFDPFGSELAFLLGAFIFEDVGVTAYKGAAPLISDKTILETAAGLLAVEAYHAGTVRTVLYAQGAFDETQKISDLRDAADGPGDKDQGILLNGEANIVPTDANGLAFSRAAQEVLNIVYLGSAGGGGFFPNRLNGTLA